MELKNKIGNLIEIDWKHDLHELQPDNVKVPVNIEYLKTSILKHGFALPFAVWNNKGKYYCVDGHTRKEVLNELIADGVSVPDKLKAFEVLAKNRKEAINILIEVYNQKHNPFAEEVLMEWLELEEIELEEIPLESLNILGEGQQQEEESEGQEKKEKRKKLEERFLVPPFSVLETKRGYWQQRKEWWLDKGLKSELGRDVKLFSAGVQPPVFYDLKNELREKGLPHKTKDVWEYAKNKGVKLFGDEEGCVSIFDPVLCELSYRWFCPDNGKILDPFAGGSVRGIVASYIDYEYLGNDLREEQIIANRQNAVEVLKEKEIYPTWTIGDSTEIDKLAKDYEADMVFSCPPYADLEVYSDNPKDISNMDYEQFLKAYQIIISKSCEKLKNDRFAVFVVGDIRDKKGFYRNFVSDTIQCFQNAGLKLYNEMILVNAVGSLAIRAGGFFNASRKVGKQHQNVLVFYKGDPKNIKANFGELDLSEAFEDLDNE